MNILDEIVFVKKKEVELLKKVNSFRDLEARPSFSILVHSMKEALSLTGASGIIGEFKRRSPSNGIINDQVKISEVVLGYEAAGVSGISVLTDASFFGGSESAESFCF